LVELLMMIAIICILMLLLLPALRHARDRARRGECASNFRQILAASFVYTQDNDGILPNLNSGTGGSMGGYYSTEQDPIYVRYLGLRFPVVSGRVTMPKLLVCPGIEYNVSNICARATSAGSYRARIGENIFGYRMGFVSFLGAVSDLDCFINGRGVRLGHLNAASYEVLLFDALSQRTAAPTDWLIPHGSATTPDGLNQGFADGSVRWFNWEEVNRYYRPDYNWDRQIQHFYHCPPQAKFNRGGYPSNPENVWSRRPWDWVGIINDANCSGGYVPQ
jgi:competence protein ComGC